MQGTLTPARAVLMVLYFALDDIELETVARHAGVPLARLEDLDGMISLADVVNLVDSAVALTGDPSLGLQIGQDIGVELLDLVGMLVSCAPNVRAAIDALTRYLPLICSLGSVQLVEEGATAKLVLHLHPELVRRDSYYYLEVTATAFLSIARRLIDGDVRMRRFNTTRAAPAWHREYPAVLGEEAEYCFGAGENSFEFDRALLDLPMKQHSPGLYQQLRKQAAKRLASLPQPELASASVKRLIDQHIGKQLIDLPLVADLTGMTPRTLQRRLKEEGISFQALLDDCRHRLARTQLTSTTRPVEDIAAMLGYSEPSNFYRAFKAWSGLTPSEFRRLHGGSP